MTLDEYLDMVKATWAPGPSTDHILFAMVGLTGEVGEVANIAAKCMRGDFSSEDFRRNPERRKQLIDEMGGVAWYLIALSWKLGIPFSEVMERNAEKLRSRLQRGVIRGDGDDR